MAEKKSPGAGDPQNQPETFIVPMAQDPAKAAAEAAAKAAMEAALQAASQVEAQTQISATRGNLRINSLATNRRLRRNTQRPFVWLKSPGTLIWGVASHWQFVDNAMARGLKERDQAVEKIRCSRYENDSKIYLWVTSPLDGDGIRVKLVHGRYEANIADWMFEEGIAPRPGISQKFDLVVADEVMLGGLALRFDTNQAQKTTYFETSRKDHDDDEESTPAKKKGKDTDDENE